MALPPPTPCPGCWEPAVHPSWQWQLGGKLDSSVNVRIYENGLPTARFCPRVNRYGFNSLRKRLPLGPWRIACR